MADDPLDQAKAATAVVGELIKVAAESPKAREACEHVGDVAVIVTKAVKNVLFPLAAINFAFDKARLYFTTKFEGDLSEKTKGIPIEHIVEPKPSIAGPALQGLAFSHEEQSLRDMYLNLISKAMDGREASHVHPAFVEIIKQLNQHEAILLREMVKFKSLLPIVEVRIFSDKSHSKWIFAESHIIDSNKIIGGESDIKYISSKIDNFIRLGLFVVDYEKELADKNEYNFTENHHIIVEIEKREAKENIIIKKGIVLTTSLGKEFARCVGLY